MHARMPGRCGPGRGRGRAVRGTAGPGDVRGREPGSHLLRGGAHLRLPRRPDRPGHQGRPGRGGQHARRPGGDVLVPAELRERGHRIPQSLLRHRKRRGSRPVAPAVPGRPVRAALALVRAPGRPAAPRPAVRAAENDPLRAPAEQAGGRAGRPVPLRRHDRAVGRDPQRGPHGPLAWPRPARPRLRGVAQRRGHHRDREDRRRGSPPPRLHPLQARLCPRPPGPRTGCGTGRRTGRPPPGAPRACRAR